MEPHFC